MQKSRSFEHNLGYFYSCVPCTPPPLVTYFSTAAVECFCVHMCVLPQFIAPNSKLMALDKAETHNSTPLYLALVVRMQIRSPKDYYIDGRNTRFCQYQLGEDFKL